jgi:cell division protein FtsL
MYRYGNVAVKYRDPEHKRAKEQPLKKRARSTQVRRQVRYGQTEPIRYGQTSKVRHSQTETSVGTAKRKRDVQSEAAVQSKPGLSGLEKGVYLLAVVTVISVLALLLAQNAMITQVNYDVQSNEQDVAELQDKNAMLEMEIAELSSPERIIGIAEKELGMQSVESRVRVLSQ